MIRRMLHQLINWASRRPHDETEYSPLQSNRKFRGLNTVSTSSNEIESRGFKLNVYRASGGIVVESTIYDEKKDRNLTGLYVIADDADIGKEISKIITVEGMKL